MFDHSTLHQAKLNLDTERFTLARQQTTHQVRSLIQQLTGQQLTAQEVLREGRYGNLEVLSEHGWLVITADSDAKNSRLWRWNVEFVPVGLYRAS
jgi:hypothetical protein